MYLTLLQIVADQAVNLEEVDVKESLNLLTLLLKGGWVMIPLIGLSLLVLFFGIERFITISKAKINESFMSNIKSLILANDIQGAKSLCATTNSPTARMIEKGISRIGRPIKEIESAVEAVGKLEIAKLEKNINILGIVAGIAPMLGFVGTISGVIRIFYNIAIESNISIGGIAEGLYEKMITSASGLVVGIFAHIIYHILNILIERISFKMESNAMEFIDLLHEN